MKGTNFRSAVIFLVFLLVVGSLAGLIYHGGNSLGKVLGPRGFLGIGWDDYLVIRDVLPNSPAEDAGLKVRDQIVSINGVKAVGRSEVNRLISENSPGSRIKIEILRDGKKMTVWATLIRKPQE